MILGHFTNHFIIMQKCYDKVFQIKKYHPEIMLVMGIMGCLFLMGNTALIDTGIMNTPLHVACAGQFFICSILATFYNTFIGWILFRKAKVSGCFSFILKLGLAVALFFQGYLSFSNSDIKGGIHNYLEFTLAFSVIGNFLILAYDARKWNFVY